jgi:hypothetical protein
MLHNLRRILLLVFICLSLQAFANTSSITRLLNISPQIALPIGVKIWFNECGGSIDGLTSWNDGESFASLGIGHFIWHPYTGKNTAGDEFPHLIRYMQARGITVPKWLQGHGARYCPWANRIEFIRAQYSPQMIELRDFLRATIAIQAEYMAYHLEEVLPELLASVPPAESPVIYTHFYNIARTPNGIYALVDYLNFKGAGTSPIMRHSVRASGLLQVLRGMNYAPHYLTPLQAYVWSAKNALTRRVANAPATSHENRWLAGWFKRLNTYLAVDIVPHQVAMNG